MLLTYETSTSEVSRAMKVSPCFGSAQSIKWTISPKSHSEMAPFNLYTWETRWQTIKVSIFWTKYYVNLLYRQYTVLGLSHVAWRLPGCSLPKSMPYVCNWIRAVGLSYKKTLLPLNPAFSQVLEPRISFPDFWPFWYLFLLSNNRQAKFGANWRIRSWAISGQTHACAQFPFCM
jgi:hypothetical protein